MHVDVHAVLPGGLADVGADVIARGRMLPLDDRAGIGEQPLEALAIYEVAGDLIRVVWFFYPAEPFPAGPAKR